MLRCCEGPAFFIFFFMDFFCSFFTHLSPPPPAKYIHTAPTCSFEEVLGLGSSGEAGHRV